MINLQKLVDICGYKLPTNLQNFTQKDLTEVKIFQKFIGGGGYFFLKHPVVYMCEKQWCFYAHLLTTSLNHMICTAF